MLKVQMDKPEPQMFIKNISLPQRRVFFDKLIDTQLAKTLPSFSEPKVSLRFLSQNSAIGTYPEPTQPFSDFQRVSL